jgi:hypothetical protein
MTQESIALALPIVLRFPKIDGSPCPGLTISAALLSVYDFSYQITLEQTPVLLSQMITGGSTFSNSKLIGKNLETHL